ncbi:MAG: hypothetical protein Q8K85_19205 [Hyphomicrobium sp.]|nr:hypothetical protein [Hyphomicrobium sp.]
MFTTPYPSTPEYQAYMVRAHRLRAAAVAGAFRDLARWVSAAAR